MADKNDLVLFMAFYDAEQYKLLLKYADDRKKLDDKWEDWLINFIQAKNNFQRNFTVEDFYVDVQKMQDYFKSKKLKNTMSNRAEYTRVEGMNAYNRKLNNLPED